MKLARLFARIGARPAAECRAYRSVARTHIGRVRQINEDRLLDLPERGLWAIADGMGGHSAGDVAATAVIDELHAMASGAGSVERGAIDDALQAANRAIHAVAAGRVSGSTVAGLAIDGSTFTLFWAGDSRVYRLAGDRLDQLTHDHSLVQQLVDRGALLPGQAADHPQANVITRALGIGETIDVAYASGVVDDGDVFLLCSDGLSGLVPPADIARLLQGPIDTAAAALVAAALAAGGSDNISLIVVAACTHTQEAYPDGRGGPRA